MKIMINPGHGGTDPGACYGYVREADVAFNIARRVESYLRKVGYDVKLEQIDGLERICDACNDWDADLFVSIHCNAGGGTGTETYHYEYSHAGKKLAACIQRQIVNSLSTVDRGLKTKIFGSDGYPYDVFVCKYTDCPAVLVETAFIDDDFDYRLLRDRQDDFASAIARGITDYVAENPLPDIVDR